jgi:LuxR family maltose regulon positive regulatory protein
MRARLQISAGDLEPAAAWARDRALHVDEHPDYLREYEHLTLARLLLAQDRAAERPHVDGPTSPLTTAHRLLGRLHDAAAAAGREGSLLEVRALQALAHRAGGDKEAALEVLGLAVAGTPEPDNHVRLFVDEGAPMLELVHDAAGTDGPGGQHQLVRAWARQLLERAQPPVDGPVARESLPDPLSRREAEVLRLLDSELTGPEIAGQLYVSLNTLRTHTKRIYTKLDVKTRAAAVRRARERGLI